MRMKQLGRVIWLIIFAMALSLQVQAGPWDTCCAPGMVDMSGQTESGGADSYGSHLCFGQMGCDGDRHSSGPSRLPCSSSACAMFAATSVTAMSVMSAWASVLVSHPETTYVSVITTPLERPPKNA